MRRALGAGGLGVVYEAVDRDSGATVAIKTLHDVTPEALYRLKREFRLLQGLEHANVCQHYELFEHDGRWFITMECVRGEHLLQAVRDELGKLDETWLRDALVQLAEALCALHDAGLVHRDLKSTNVLVEPSGRVVLIDFGFVEGFSGGQRSQSIVGTPSYMAPEQAVQADVGPAADWYSFGVLLFEALTNRLPHEGETALAILVNKQQADAPRAASIAPGVPEDLDALCADLLRLDPTARPSGAAVLRRLGKRDGARDSRPALSSSSVSIASTFVGRGDELAELHGAFRDLHAGHAVSVLVEGPSGVGKSALVRQFSEEMLAQEALVLAGRCYERESVPYKAFDSVVDALARHLRRLPDIEVTALLPRHPDLLVRMFPVLGAVPALVNAPVRTQSVGDPHELRNQAFGALREVLHRLSARRPVVITIDDWQWADADSVLLARDLVRNRDSPPMLLVLTARPAAPADSAARVDAIRTPEMRHIQLASLVEAHAIELVSQLRRSYAPSLELDLAAIARETQGHPLYISELVRYAATRGSSADGDTAIRLDDAIRARIAELPVEARVIVDVLAVAGEPLPLDIVRDVVDLDPGLVQRSAAMLRVAHLVRGGLDGAIEPYHDRVRQAVLEGMADDTRLALHKRLAYALEASPLARSRPELMLFHLDVAGEHARAAEVAVAAAQRAVTAGAFDQAAGLYGLALRSGHLDPMRSRALRIAMGQALANAGRGHEAAEAFLEVAREADPALRLDCHRQAAEQMIMVGDLERGLATLGALLADVGVAMPATQKRALASVLWRRARLRLRGLEWKERRATEIAPETLLRVDVLKAASHSLALVDNIRAADFNVRLLLDALAIGERSRCALALASESVYQSSQGGRGVIRARKLIETVRALGQDASDPKLRAFVLMSEGAVEYWVCQLGRAIELVTEAERTFREETTGTSLELKSTRMFLAFALRHRGAWAQLRALREQYVEDAQRRGDRYVATSLDRYCSPLWLGADDAAGARRMIADAKWILPKNAFHAQHWYELEARGEIAIYERTVRDEMAELEPLFAGLEKSVLLRVTTVRAGALWLRGRLALRLGDAAGVRHAIDKLARVDKPRAPVVRALLETGLPAAKDITVAKLRDAITLAERYDLRLHAAAARYKLGTLILGTEGAEHRAAAERTFAAEGIAKPARFADWYAPRLQK